MRDRRPKPSADFDLVYSLAFDPTLPSERGLLAAILDRAIRDATDPYLEILDLHRQGAIEWIYSELEDPFTFIWTAQELDLSPIRLLQMIEAKGVIYPRRWRLDLPKGPKTCQTQEYLLLKFCPYIPKGSKS